MLTLMAGIKGAAAAATLIGLLLGFLERWRAPHVRVTEDSPTNPKWLGWMGWALTALGAIGYLVLDLITT
ncbi:MAG: hypothetical protein HYV19_04325 [Gemmatimonadetes bacterium]|nr:hypothetical protein [Gemmatimonadota bacterium]